jgi:type I restriction enzyme S subunit
LEDLKRLSTGIAIPGISRSDVLGKKFPLPPLEEQKRIVEKVDRLMEQCDRLEQLHKEREQKRIIVHAAACDRLLNAKGDRELQTAWEFLRDRFGDLYAVKENISELRKAILQLAVMGKLVPQDPNDPPASELLKEIQAEKQRLIKEGKIKKQKPLQTIKDDLNENIPKSWLCTKIDDLCIVSGGIQKTTKRVPVNNHYPYLGVSNVQRGYLSLEKVKRFELKQEELEKYLLQKNDLLVVEGNGSPEEIGRCAIWHGEINNCVHQNHLIKCRPVNSETSNYLLLFLNSPLGIAEIQKLAVTTSGLYTLNMSKVRGINLLLPPLPEQYRIVAKVDQLMQLCDQLESKIDQQTQTQTRLLNALIDQLNNT